MSYHVILLPTDTRTTCHGGHFYCAYCNPTLSVKFNQNGNSYFRFYIKWPPTIQMFKFFNVQLWIKSPLYPFSIERGEQSIMTRFITRIFAYLTNWCQNYYRHIILLWHFCMYSYDKLSQVVLVIFLNHIM